MGVRQQGAVQTLRRAQIGGRCEATDTEADQAWRASARRRMYFLTSSLRRALRRRRVGALVTVGQFGLTGQADESARRTAMLSKYLKPTLTGELDATVNGQGVLAGLQ